MNAPAVPKYVNDAARDFSDYPPGHRFNLYFPIWKEVDWQLDKNNKANALQKSLKLGSTSKLLEALRKRQKDLVDVLPDDCHFVREAYSTAPFATGLGLEHPIENGFAFLSPYGLPYLAGSGVKGVLRRAGEELYGEGCEIVNALFGHEDANDARRGALSCWDVFPAPPNDELVIEIMTPHYSDYYQGNSSPHDAGKPNPIPFLAVPASSQFRFIITCEPSLLANVVAQGEWKILVAKIIDHAFEWLGFGAKTAVGYGAMKSLSDEEIEKTHREAEASSSRCDWVEESIPKLAKKYNIPEHKLGDVLRGKPLAEAWEMLTDENLKARALADIRSRWQKEGFWESPTGAAKKAKAIYCGEK